MKHTSIFSAVALALTFAAGSASALTKDQYNTRKEAIKAEYKVNKDKCDALQDNAKDICKEEAKGTEKVAKAQLEFDYKPTAKNNYKLNMAKADALYEVSKERCDDKSGNDKDVCVKEAKAVYTSAKANAKVTKAEQKPNADKTEKAAEVSEAKAEAAADKREAAYKAVAEKCDALSGDAKDKCVADAKRKFGQD